jgi:ATP-dependent helicase STH1/SNF2
MQAADTRQWFHNPVSKQEVPHYRKYVKKPICIKDMKNKCNRREYKEKESFLADVALMRQNSELFNGEAHEVTQVARRLEEICQKEIEAKLEEILTYESLVKEL